MGLPEATFFIRGKEAAMEVDAISKVAVDKRLIRLQAFELLFKVGELIEVDAAGIAVGLRHDWQTVYRQVI